MLHYKIKIAMDLGHIVIVPVAAAQEQHTRWKIIVTDKSMAGMFALAGMGVVSSSRPKPQALY